MATLITKSGPPEESIHEKDGQFMQVVSVRPVQEPRSDFEGREIPDKVLTYYLTNNVRTFVSDRPLHKGQVDRQNEFKSLWVERSTLTVADRLPGILRWSEVVSKKITELSPIEHACETVENMNHELEKLIVSYSLEPSKPISPLSMRLQGVIEAAVNGGVAKYQDAFFNPKYIHLHPEQGAYIRRLKQLILQKVRILEGGLSLHGRLAPTNIQPLQRRLLERLTLMRANVMEASSNVMDSSLDSFHHRRNPSIIHTPLPPIPTLEPVHDHSSLPPNFMSDRRSSDVYQAPNKEQNGNLSNGNNNNYHDVIYAVPQERFSNPVYNVSNSNSGSNTSVHEALGSSVDGLVLTDGSGNIIDATSPPPLPPKRPKRPRSTGLNTSMDMASPSTPTTPPPPRPPIPVGITSTNNIGLINCNSNDSSLIQRSRSIPRSNNSFQLANLMQSSSAQLSQVISQDPGNGNLYTPSPTRMVNNHSSHDLLSPEVPPRTITHPLTDLNRTMPRATSAKEVQSLATNVRNSVPSSKQVSNVSQTQIKVANETVTDDEARPVLPPKTVRKTISSNQLDAPAVTVEPSRISNVNVVSISVNGSHGHKTSTLPNRRPPPPTPPLESGGSPPPPHHPPPPAPPLSCAEESELLSMSLASNLSLLEDVSDDTISDALASGLLSSAASSVHVQAKQPMSVTSCSSSGINTVSVITVNSTIPSTMSNVSLLNGLDRNEALLLQQQSQQPCPSTIIRVNTSEARKSSQSTGSNSSSSSSTHSMALDDIKGV